VRSRVPAAFRPPALASWTVLFPPRELGLPCGRLTEQRLLRTRVGVPTFHMHEIRPGWVPPTPRDGGVPAAGQMPPTAACRFSAASPAPRCHIPPAELILTRRQQGFTHVHPSGLLLTCSPRVERGPSGLNPELRTPPLPATHVRPGTDPRTLIRNYTFGIIISRPPSMKLTQLVRLSCRTFRSDYYGASAPPADLSWQRACPRSPDRMPGSQGRPQAVPTFTMCRSARSASRYYPGSITTPTPQTFTVASPPAVGDRLRS
jgi:hypothetical protein